ncbi:MAG TPA: thiamine pyrophosphate-dependent enzyme [Rhabdochlamydiaceae bacterium]|jgi:pyruvate dehydrogenase E1 component alpha subunit
MSISDAVKKATLIKFEEEIADIFTAGKIRAPVHLSDGNEDALIAVFKNIKSDDWVFSTHRSHYHALLHGINPDWLREEIVRGNSISICNPMHFFYSSGIVGGCPPIALGVAMALKRNQAQQHVWVFVGDMAAEGGIFHECVKYAERNALPITFIVEDNGISTYTPTQKAWGDAQSESKIVVYHHKKEKYPHYGSGKWVTFG